jgi:hypothetical protein
MRKNLLLLLLVPTVILPASCGKHVYMMKGNEIENYAKEARDPAYESFVIYNKWGSPDTLKGTTLVRKHSKLIGKDKWFMDGKEISIYAVLGWQDSEEFRSAHYTRIFRGRASLYINQTDNSTSSLKYDAASKTYIPKSSGGTLTTFSLQMGSGDISVVTFERLKIALNDCPAALKQADEEFKETIWQRKPETGINDYRALIRILKVYNDCK